ncbi:MAG: beta-glucosidase [Acidobacteriota bacterium]|nr:beta-glucosidase [Acidobacteriota bacterium]
MTDRPLFPSFFIGGFECSTHFRRRDRRRLDLLASTRHDVFARQDYERLQSVGIRAARDGVPWYAVDRGAGRYDWSRVVPMLRAARETRTQVVWDLLHFGFPDDVEPFAAGFVERFRLFARAFARVLAGETDETPFIAPVNEISFMSWAGGEEGFFNPFAHKRGDALKAQLVRAFLAGTAEVRNVLPAARIVSPEPIIEIIASPKRPQDRLLAENYRLSQFQAWDMISGRQSPELGGSEDALDIIGMNYYVQNQWIHEGAVLVPSHPHHLPLRYMFREVWERYRRPLFVAETGVEAQARPEWLRYVGRETRAAARLGVEIHGLCWYPILNHAGWEDDRHCPNGLWDYADDAGNRAIYAPLAAELARQQRFLDGREPPEPSELLAPDSDADLLPKEELAVLDLAARDLDEVTTKSREA